MHGAFRSTSESAKILCLDKILDMQDSMQDTMLGALANQ